MQPTQKFSSHFFRHIFDWLSSVGHFSKSLAFIFLSSGCEDSWWAVLMDRVQVNMSLSFAAYTVPYRESPQRHKGCTEKRKCSHNKDRETSDGRWSCWKENLRLFFLVAHFLLFWAFFRVLWCDNETCESHKKSIGQKDLYPSIKLKLHQGYQT